LSQWISNVRSRLSGRENGRTLPDYDPLCLGTAPLAGYLPAILWKSVIESPCHIDNFDDESMESIILKAILTILADGPF
jgi:hypothetical protein